MNHYFVAVKNVPKLLLLSIANRKVSQLNIKYSKKKETIFLRN